MGCSIRVHHSVAAGLRCRTGRGTAGWGAACGSTAADRNLNTDHARNAACLTDRNLLRNTPGTCHHLGFTHLAAGRVRHSPSAGLRHHTAGCVGNPLRHTVTDHATGRVRNSLRDAVVRPRAGDVRNPLGACLVSHAANRIRNLSRPGFLSKTARRVGNFTVHSIRNPPAGRVWHFAMTDLGYHGRTADAFLHDTGNPALAADRSSRTLNAGRFTTA